MTGPQPRPNVGDIPAYVPGRPPTVRPGMTSYKLSSNENPYPPLPGVVEAATRAVETMNRYPDMGSTALYDALAARLGVPAGHLAAATGSVALIYQLLAAYCDPGDEVVYAWRSFEAYPIAVAAAAATSRAGAGHAATAGHDLDAMADGGHRPHPGRDRLHPQQPDRPGRHPDRARRVPRPDPRPRRGGRRRGLRRVRPDGRPGRRSRDPRRHPNVVLFRTFSKAYGLAGFRVGYAVAQPDVAAALRAVSLPFGVSAVAQAAAIASLEAEAELMERVDALVAERARVAAGLSDAGWDVPEAQGNFFWFALGERTADFAAAADERGIVVRPFAGEGCRVSVGEVEANDRLVELAETFVMQG